MKTALILATAFATLLGVLVKTVIDAMAQEEAPTRLSRLPFVLIRMATARLPRDLRDDLASEWQAELHHVLHDTEGMPHTRLWRGIRYSTGLLLSAPAVADGLKGRTTRLTRWARIIGAGGTVGYAIWLLIYTWDYFHPAAAQVLHSWLSPLQPQPTPDQLTLTGISYLCGAAAFLGTAALLATGRWLIANLNTLCFVAAGGLSYLGGGPLYSIVLAAVVFSILVAAVSLRLRNSRRTHAARSS